MNAPPPPTSMSWRTSNHPKACRWRLPSPSYSASSTWWTFSSSPAPSTSPRSKLRKTCLRGASSDSASASVRTLMSLHCPFFFSSLTLFFCFILIGSCNLILVLFIYFFFFHQNFPSSISPFTEPSVLPVHRSASCQPAVASCIRLSHGSL